MTDPGPHLNPAQRQVDELLRSPGAARPSFPADLGERLRQELEDAVEGLAAPGGADDGRLWVSKFALGAVHACEARFLHDDSRPFQLSPLVVAGTVAHRAIQFSQHWDEAVTAHRLVDEAAARLVDDQDRTGTWLLAASSAERADVRATAVDRVTKFLECFPPLRPSWRPVVESPMRVELAGGRVVLSGRVDLVLGRADGNVAGKAFVDFKTGGSHAGHADDLRFYALLEVLRLGVPPFRLASYYLDQGRLVTEDVTEALLHSASRRVAHGVVKLADLRSGVRAPERRPGSGCRWCPLVAGCDEGRRHLALACESGAPP